MKLCIDSADVKAIKKICEYYPIDGVSTNPSILAKTNRKPFEVLKEIRSIIGDDKELFVQVISKDAEGMVKEAKRIVIELGRDTVVKIPCTIEGYKAIKLLKQEGIRTLGTAVYTTMQGFLAAKCGCEYVAPYVNRIDNLGYDGVKIAKDIHDAIVLNNLDSGLLAASFKNSKQVLELIQYGVKAITCSPEMFDTFSKNAAVDDAIEKFIKDFEDLTSKGMTMEKC